MTTLKVTAPKLRVQANGRDALTLLIDGVEYHLMGDHDNPRVRNLMSALHMAQSVTLSIREDRRFKVCK